MRLSVLLLESASAGVGEVGSNSVGVFWDPDGGGEDELVDPVFVLEGVPDGQVPAEGVAEEREPFDSPDFSPFLESVDEPVFGFGDFGVGVFALDAEAGTGAAAVAEEVEGPDLPSGLAGEGVVVAVEVGEARAVPVEHDEVVRGRFGGAGYGEFVEDAVVPGEGDHVGGAGARAMWVGGGGGGGGGGVSVVGGECWEGVFEGEEVEDGGFGGGGGEGGPLGVLAVVNRWLMGRSTELMSQ